MNMHNTDQNFTFEDIGAQAISSLAEGLYPNARDPIREYVQNAVDAKATIVALSVSGESITIENDGQGMDPDDLQQALQIAISKKDPNKDVGYKGIGIYSGMLISQNMTIKSRKNGMCSQLLLNFEKMNDLIRLNSNIPEVINGAKSVESIEDFTFIDKALEGDGTQVKLTGIPNELKSTFEKQELSEYLTNTLPLLFNPNFCYANEIDKKIREVSDEVGYGYRTVTLHLTVNGDRSTLYRPYDLTDDKIFKPRYEFVQFAVSGNQIKFALVWGCLNKLRKVIPDKQQRGFRIRQKGFTIGDADTALSYFKRKRTLANRHIGEIIILSNHIKANTARSDIWPTEHSREFRAELQKIATKYEKHANIYQESSKALDECSKLETELQKFNKEPNGDTVSLLKTNLESLRKRLKQPLDAESKLRVNELIEKLENRLLEWETNNCEMNGNDSSKEPSDAESDNEDDSDDDEDDSDTSSLKQKRGLKENSEVTKILTALNKDGINSAPQARKIQQLYNSLCTVSFKQHSSLAYIGTWALWEIIGAVLNTDSPNQNRWKYLKETMKHEYHTNDRNKYLDMKRALQFIQDEGNVNKHSPIGMAEEDGSMLRNRMEVLEDFFLLMIKKIYKKLTDSDWDKLH